MEKSKDYPSKILVFDWAGELIETYLLPFVPYLFSVDEKTKVLYIVRIIDDEDDLSAMIYAYQL